jgi:hypothetical protein
MISRYPICLLIDQHCPFIGQWLLAQQAVLVDHMLAARNNAAKRLFQGLFEAYLIGLKFETRVDGCVRQALEYIANLIDYVTLEQ